MPDTDFDIPSEHLNDALIFGDIDEALLDRNLVIAHGKRRDDMNFTNIDCTVEQLLVYLSTIEKGQKDGACILQGSVTGSGGQRIAVNMINNYILMLDVDNGMTFNDIRERITNAGLFAVIWPTASHMTASTEIMEKALQTWCNKKRISLGFEDTEVIARCVSYLTEEKGYYNYIFENAPLTLTRRHEAGGVRYILTHNPIPKHRVLFVLSEPFSFSQGGTQATRIALWKDTYKAVATALGITIDTSGSDPSRLMYTPRKANKSEEDHVYIYAGKTLDLNDYTLGSHFASNTNLRMGRNNTGTRIQETNTPGLKEFVKNAKDFDAVSMMLTLYPDGDRGPTTSGTGRNFECPNSEAHTTQNLQDKAFFVTTTEGGGWFMSCLHQTCKDASGGDRLFYLDKFCANHGLTVDDLRPYSTNTQVTLDKNITLEDLWRRREQRALDPAQVIKDIELATNTDAAELCKIIALLPLTHVDEAVQKLSEATSITKRNINTMVKDARKEHKAVKDSATPIPSTTSITFAPPDPPADLSDVATIWRHWDYNIQRECLSNRVTKRNKETPTLFLDARSRVVRLVPGYTGKTPLLITNGDWASYVTECATYKSFNPTTGVVAGIRFPDGLINDVRSVTDAFPVLVRFITVPVFGPDGSLILTDGYNFESQYYIELDKKIDLYPVSVKPADEEIATAVWWLHEATRDFPFSDEFGKADDTPIRLTDEDGNTLLDEDGYPLPNLKRGRSSRVNFFALCIQPFIRALIKGPCLAYHIDKASPGTGANFLMDVASIIINGARIAPTTMASNDDEFRKNMVAQLLEQPNILFIDNINRKVESEQLASCLVSGVWRDRVLGQSTSATIPVTATMVLAGNNLSFSHELMRRNCPVRLDAATPNPAKDRGGKDFKHNLQDWCMEHRCELIWSCQTLVAAWVAEGMPRDKTATVNSFAEMTESFAGLFAVAAKACQRQGYDVELETAFGSNITNYTNERDDDHEDQSAAVEKLYTHFQYKKFTANEAFQAMVDPFTNRIDPIFGNASSYTETTPKSFGRWLTQHVVRAAFNVTTKDSNNNDTVAKVSLNKGREKGVATYRFSDIKKMGGIKCI